jgi:DNA-binding transcriptional regulator YdaS (Cro superfamily)
MDGLNEAIKKADSQAKLAALLESHTGKPVKQQNVSYWLKTRVPAEWCIPINQVVGVSPAKLRPDLFGEIAAA